MCFLSSTSFLIWALCSLSSASLLDKSNKRKGMQSEFFFVRSYKEIYGKKGVYLKNNFQC